MCRLFGCRSATPGGVAHELVHGANALRVQSREHPDGWGVGWYVGRVPQVVRSLSAAHGDEDFEEVSSFVTASTIVAHIRKASVGGISLQNTHPFEWGPWLFAHNGTIPGWEKLAACVEAEIDAGFRAKIQGETDSERCFYLFLTRLAQRCDPTSAKFADAAAALADTVAIVGRCARGASGVDVSTTFLCTDGRLMLACRKGRTLHVEAPEPDADGRVGWFAVASEDPRLHEPAPAGRPPWRAVAPGAIVGVDADLRLCRASLESG
jgi:predicted glutamine amidotransferase